MKTTFKALFLAVLIGALLVVVVGPRLTGSASTGPARLPSASSSAAHAAAAPTAAAPAPSASSSSADPSAEVSGLQAAVQANPGDVDSVTRLAGLYGSSGNYAGAADLYAAAIEADPGSARLHSGLAGAFLHLGLFGSARIEYQKAIKLDPNLAEAHMNLGVLLAYGTPADPDGARAQWNTVIQIDPASDIAQKAQQYLQQLATGH